MMTSRRDTAERLWLKLTAGRQQAPVDEANELKTANTARLRQARLSKEAEEKVRADLAVAKTARRKVS